MKMGKIGCFFIYSIVLIVIGMGIYKYREPILKYISEKYSEIVQTTHQKVDEAKDKLQN